MAQALLALSGCQCISLGLQTPLNEMVAAVHSQRADVLALSFSSYASRKDVVDNLQQLREQLPPQVEIWVGGTAAHVNRRALPPAVVVMRKACDVSAQVQTWRRQCHRVASIDQGR